MSGLLGDIASVVEKAMEFRMARQGVLASNLANVDTPGYRRADLRFDAELSRAANRMQQTSAGHEAGGDGPDGSWELTTARNVRGPDQNTVDPDAEVIELSRNAGAFNRQAEIFARLIAMTRIAVDGRS